MGAKPKKTRSAAKVPAKKKRAPARRVPARRAASKSGRATREPTVDAYVAGLAGELAETAALLRRLVLNAAPSASESIKWGQPVYDDNGPFCFFKAGADHITFGFWRGNELEDPEGRLEGDDDRMRHVTVHSADEVDEDLLSDWVRQAVDLNRRLGNPTRATNQSEVVRGPDGEDEAESDEDVESGEEAETWRSSAAGDYGDAARETDPSESESSQSSGDDDD